ncbi:hypothetical protein WDU94_014817 [Cyamophila willieti]
MVLTVQRIEKKQKYTRRLKAANLRRTDRPVFETFTIVEEIGSKGGGGGGSWLGPTIAELKRSASIRKWLQQNNAKTLVANLNNNNIKTTNNNNNSPPEKDMPMLIHHPALSRAPHEEACQPLDFSVAGAKFNGSHTSRSLHSFLEHSSVTTSSTSDDDGKEDEGSPRRDACEPPMGFHPESFFRDRGKFNPTIFN